jgi:pimeloyl-ACP methyl ester carboxylesterase
LVCVHGTLGDFRTWYAVLGPLSKKHRVISVSLRHFFPEHWDGVGDDYRMAQHVADVIAFIEQVDPRPVDLMGHSRGGHISFRVAQARPELVRHLVLAEPGGDLDVSLDPSAKPGTPSALSLRVGKSSVMVKSGDIEGALQNFFDGIDGDGAWRRVYADRPNPRKSQTLFQGRRAGGSGTDAFHRRCRYQRIPALDHTGARSGGCRRKNRDDPGLPPLDVRAGARGVLPHRDAVSREVIFTSPPASLTPKHTDADQARQGKASRSKKLKEEIT